MGEQTRHVQTHIGPDGNPMAHVTMSPASNRLRCHVEAPPDQAIPIIFLPGIMGSPLMATGRNRGMVKESDWAWFPDAPITWVGGIQDSYRTLSPSQRKSLLDPKFTRALQVTDRVHHKVVAKHVGSILPLEVAFQRGWGTVAVASYGKVLQFLEAQLRFIVTPQYEIYPGILGAMPRDPEKWGRLQGSYVPLDKSALKAAAKFQYPVFAVGYNWLESNGEAARHLLGRTREILDHCTNTLNLECRHGVILVTHSMGGLVARCFAKANPELVQGVVHGAQPALGAATAYRRLRAGWEDALGAWALGERGFQIVPVFANASGPLELLPNHRYGAGWLQAKSADGAKLFALPYEKDGKADPYEQIYAQPNAWWRLIDPACIDPLETKVAPEEFRTRISRAWAEYLEKLGVAKDFHLGLGDYYHENTYAFYGADAGRKAFRSVTWKFVPDRIPAGQKPATLAPRLSAPEALALRLKWDSYGGRVTMVNRISQQHLVAQHGEGRVYDTLGTLQTADIQDADQVGDATVPAHSADDSAKHARFSVAMTGFEHQGAFDDLKAQYVTLHAILHIGAAAKEKPAAGPHGGAGT